MLIPSSNHVFPKIFILIFSSDLKLRILLVLFCCYFAVLFIVYSYIYNMATKHTINEEDLVLSGDSTMEYGDSSEYENDCSTDEYPSSIMSRSTWAYGVVVTMFDFHRSDRGSNPGRGSKIS